MKQTLADKLQHFFQEPNGTTFLEGDLLAVKIPIGTDPRYGMVLTGSLYGSASKNHAAFPRRDFELSADCYVDNQTGARILCDSYSPFQYKFSYNENSLSYSDAVSEVRKQVQIYLENLSEDRLFDAAISVGDNPMEANALTDYEKEKLLEICERAYALGDEPEYSFDPYYRADIDPRSQNAALFAISYFNNKDQLIRDTAENALRMCARDLIHSKVLVKELSRLQESIEISPPYDLEKERRIREALNGKSSIWATFTNGRDTLRMSIPTTVFTTDHRLSTYKLTNKEQERLEAFLFPDKNQRWGSYVQTDHIVALEYKNKLLYLDDRFYSQYSEQMQEKTSVADKLKDATERAASQNRPSTTSHNKDKGEFYEL